MSKPVFNKDGRIIFIWYIEDVKIERPDLDKNECWAVLEKCKLLYDEINMNRVSIREQAAALFPLSLEQKVEITRFRSDYNFASYIRADFETLDGIWQNRKKPGGEYLN